MAKRGFCAVCDARFDLLPELFIGEGPMRSLMVPQVAELLKPPSSKIREVRPNDFLLQPAARQAAPFLLISLVLAVIAFGIAMGHAPLFVPIVFVAAAMSFAIAMTWNFGSSEQITITRDEFVVSRGVGKLRRTIRRPLNCIEGCIVSNQLARNTQVMSYVVKVLIPGEDSLVIGQNLGHSEEAMAWLARRFEKALREARK